MASSRLIANRVSNFTKVTGIPTDLYYACLSHPWEPGPTKRFFNEDRIDTSFFVPDAVVGRLPAPSAGFVKTYLKRMRRYLAKDEGLVPNSLLLHGTFLKSWEGDPPGPTYEGDDGYPWLDSQDHPRGRLAAQLPRNERVLDAELWLRNIYRRRVYPYQRPGKQWRVDLFFQRAAGDPVTRDRFTDRYSVDNPRDIDVYLRESPEFMTISGHGVSVGTSKLNSVAPAVPGNRWGISYTTACNTSQIDSHGIRGGGSEFSPPPDTAAIEGDWQPFVMGEHALVGGNDQCGGLVLTARWRDATPQELDPMRYETVPPPYTRRKYRDMEDGQDPTAAGIPALRGKARMARKKIPVLQDFIPVRAGTRKIFSLWTYFRFFDSAYDHFRYPVAELVLPGRPADGKGNQVRLQLLRQGNCGYTWQLDGKDVASAAVELDSWVHLALVVDPRREADGSDSGRFSFFRNALPFTAAREIEAPVLTQGTAYLYLGGNSGQAMPIYPENLQWIDEVAFFESDGEAGSPPDSPLQEVRRLASEPVPALRPLVVLDRPGTTRLPDFSLDWVARLGGFRVTGSGAIAVADGQRLPPLAKDEAAEIEVAFPGGGLATATEETKEALGLGGLEWQTARPPAPGWAAFGEVSLRIARFTRSGDGRLEFEVEIDSPSAPVAFTPDVGARQFRLHPVSLEDGTALPGEEPTAATVEGDKATLTLDETPEGPASRFFRIGYDGSR